MFRLFFMLILATTPFLASASRAQQMPDCPEIVTAPDLDASDTPDILVVPIVYPGAFGGKVFCILEPTANGTSLTFVEVIPSNGYMRQGFEYLSDAVLFELNLKEQDTGYKVVAKCSRRADRQIGCWADLALGGKTYVDYDFNPNGNFLNVGISIFPGGDIFPETIWQQYQKDIQAGNNPVISVFLGNDNDTKMLELEAQGNVETGNIFFAINGQPAYDFLQVQSEERFPIISTIEVIRYEVTDQGSHLSRNSHSYEIPMANAPFLVNRIFQIKNLISAGYEGSKFMDFSE